MDLRVLILGVLVEPVVPRGPERDAGEAVGGAGDGDRPLFQGKFVHLQLLKAVAVLDGGPDTAGPVQRVDVLLGPMAHQSGGAVEFTGTLHGETLLLWFY